MYGPEYYTFIMWWGANIDTSALISGMGDGTFVEAMLKNDLLPITTPRLDNLSPQGSPNMYAPIKSEQMPTPLEFHRQISILSARLGLLARDLRREAAATPSASVASIAHRNRRVYELQDVFRRTWDSQMPAYVAAGYTNESVPVESRGVFEHVSNLVFQNALHIPSTLVTITFHAKPSYSRRVSNQTLSAQTHSPQPVH